MKKETKYKTLDDRFRSALARLEGKFGVYHSGGSALGIIGKIIEAVEDNAGLPSDFNSPTRSDHGENVSEYATTLYDLFSTGAEIAQEMMLGREISHAYANREEEAGRCMSKDDLMRDAGHKNSDF